MLRMLGAKSGVVLFDEFDCIGRDCRPELWFRKHGVEMGKCFSIPDSLCCTRILFQAMCSKPAHFVDQSILQHCFDAPDYSVLELGTVSVDAGKLYSVVRERTRFR